MITHNEELAKMTDRTLIMKDGSIVQMKESTNSLLHLYIYRRLAG